MRSTDRRSRPALFLASACWSPSLLAGVRQQLRLRPPGRAGEGRRGQGLRRQRADARTCRGLAARRLRGRAASTTPGSTGGLAGVDRRAGHASRSAAGAVRRASGHRSAAPAPAPRPARSPPARLWAPATPTAAATSGATRRCTGCRRSARSLAAVAFVLVVVATPRRPSGRSARTRCCWPAWPRSARVPLPTLCAAARGGGCRSCLRAAAAVRRRRRAGRRARPVAVGRAGLLGGLEHPGQGDARRGRVVLLVRPRRAADLLLGLERLRLPPRLVQIASFMLRYADVITGEIARMRIARESRGFTARWSGRLAAVGRAAGALFVRSYERGERVHLAMLSRGYAGTMPATRRTGRTRAARVARPRSCSRRRAAAGRGDRVGGCDGVSRSPALDVDGLSFAYPDGHQALLGVSTAVGRGERVALLGPNGAGKTTLVLHLNGILPAAAGSRHGRRPAGRPAEHLPRSAAGSASSSRTRTTSCSCPPSREDVAFGPANLGLRGAALADAGARRAGRGRAWPTHADRPPHHLSLRPAPPGGGGHRAGDGPGGPGAGRAVEQPRPGQPARAGRDPAPAST